MRSNTYRTDKPSATASRNSSSVLRHLRVASWNWAKTKNAAFGQRFLILGAGDEVRTRDLDLGKVALYQLSYSRGRFRCYYLLFCSAEWFNKGKGLFWGCKYQAWKFSLLRPFHFIFRLKNLYLTQRQFQFVQFH